MKYSRCVLHIRGIRLKSLSEIFGQYRDRSIFKLASVGPTVGNQVKIPLILSTFQIIAFSRLQAEKGDFAWALTRLKLREKSRQ